MALGSPTIGQTSFFSPPAHLYAVTCMTKISLIVTLNNQLTSPHLLFYVGLTRNLVREIWDIHVTWRLYKQNWSTEGCSNLKRSVDMTSKGKNGLNIRTNASPKWDRTWRSPWHFRSLSRLLHILPLSFCLSIHNSVNSRTCFSIKSRVTMTFIS